MSISQVIEESKFLSPNERALVAHCLISSLKMRELIRRGLNCLKKDMQN